MPDFTVTYLREHTHTVRAPDIQTAADYAKKVASYQHLVVLRVEPRVAPPAPAVLP